MEANEERKENVKCLELPNGSAHRAPSRAQAQVRQEMLTAREILREGGSVMPEQPQSSSGAT